MTKKNRSVWKYLANKDCFSLFCYSVIISAIIYIIGSLVSGGWLFDKIFFLHTRDAFMDFFNSIRDASLGLGSYTERNVIYPPMANLFFVLLSKITPDAYNSTEWSDRLSWNDHTFNIVLICLFAVVCAALLCLIIYKGVKLSNSKKLLLMSVAIFSVPFLNMVERGNIMLIAFIFLLIYAQTYDSDSAFVRELGLIALALSFSIKLYPALFAWVLISDKRYKEFFRCVLYCLALLILPTFAFGGPSCLLIILENIFSFSTSSSGVLSVISSYSNIPPSLVSMGAYALFLLCALCFAVSPFIYKEQKNKWKIWLLGCVTFLSFPSLSSTYAWVLFLIPLIRIFGQELTVKEVAGYFIPAVIPFIFIPLSLPHSLTANALALYVCVFALAIYTVFDTAKNALRCLKAERVNALQ